VFEVREGGIRPTQFAPLEGKAEEYTLVDLRHLALLLVDRQFEPPIKVRGQIGFDTLACPFALDQHHQVVGITHETMPSPLQFPIQIVKQNVGQQWREHATYTKDNFEFERQIALCRSDSMLDMRRKR
jgi:hypothetical protein